MKLSAFIEGLAQAAHKADAAKASRAAAVISNTATVQTIAGPIPAVALAGQTALAPQAVRLRTKVDIDPATIEVSTRRWPWRRPTEIEVYVEWTAEAVPEATARVGSNAIRSLKGLSNDAKPNTPTS